MREHFPLGHARRCPACVARHRAYRTDAAPRVGFWAQPVGAVASVLLVLAYSLALLLMLWIVATGPEGS